MINFCELPKYNTREWLSLDSFKGEEWRDIEGFEGLYAISNYGRIKSIQRTVVRLTIGAVINSTATFQRLMDDYLLPAKKRKETINITVI